MQKRSWVAIVVAVFALVVVALSGTAMSAIIITKNGQVAAHTIAGASAPKGDNQNLITGSVGTADLHTGAVTGKKLAANTVKASDLDLTDVAKGLGVDQAYSADTPGDPADPIFSVGPWTIEGNCIDDGGGTAHATIDINTSSVPALLSVNGAAGERFIGIASTLLAQTGTVGSGSVAVKGGSFTVATATFTNHLEGQVMAVVDGDTNDYASPTCIFTFGGTGH